MFEIDTGPSFEWMPPHYTELRDACIKLAAADSVTPSCWGIEMEVYPALYVKHLSSAASKYRLAFNCNGLIGDESHDEPWAKTGVDYFERYSAQVIVMLAFIALEAYLRVLGTKWHDFPTIRSGGKITDLSDALRSSLEEGAVARLIKATQEQRLRSRLKAFRDGDNNESLAVVSAFRNAFLHGKIGISNSMDIHSAKEIRNILLKIIERDASLICSSLTQQDRSLLLL